jgi:arylsulfatase A-like enzyme
VKRPNILIVVMDTVRSDATQLDRRSRNRTPVLRNLAKSGVNFTRAYSTWDSTPPSHFSILTGYVGGYQNEEVDQPESSIAYQVKKLGYRTFGVSANPNINQRSFRMAMPFDCFIDLHELYGTLTDEEFAEVWGPIDARIRSYHAEPDPWSRLLHYSSTAHVINLLEPMFDARRPFLGFVNLMEAHDPYFPAHKYYDPSKDRADLLPMRYRKLSPELADPAAIADPARRAQVEKMIALAQGRPWSVSIDVRPEDLRTYRRRYDAAVREVDHGLGQIMEILKRKKLLDSTIVVITSDHGESFGEASLLTHAFDNQGDREATNRVPLLILFPPCYGIQPTRVDELCTIADIVPTLYELLGLDPHALWSKATPGAYGRSLISLTTKKQAVVTQLAAVRPTEAPKVAVPPEQRRQQDEEALKRFRSLGYLQ